MCSCRFWQVLCILAFVIPPGTILGVKAMAQRGGPGMPQMPAPPAMPKPPAMPSPPPRMPEMPRGPDMPRMPRDFGMGPNGNFPRRDFGIPQYVWVCSSCKKPVETCTSTADRPFHLFCPHCGALFVSNLLPWIVIAVVVVAGGAGIMAVIRSAPVAGPRRKGKRRRSGDDRDSPGSRSSRAESRFDDSFDQYEDEQRTVRTGLFVGGGILAVIVVICAALFFTMTSLSGNAESDAARSDEGQTPADAAKPSAAPRSNRPEASLPQMPPFNPPQGFGRTEIPKPPFSVSFESDPKLDGVGKKVFLSDMQEYGWKAGPTGWGFGKNGQLGNSFRADGVIMVNGAKYPKGLSMHPPMNDYTKIYYKPGGRAKTLAGTVAISEDESFPPGPVHFEILGDGKSIWKSATIRAKGVIEKFSVNVGDVKVLELRVYGETISVTGSHAVWLDPYMETK